MTGPQLAPILRRRRLALLAALAILLAAPVAACAAGGSSRGIPTHAPTWAYVDGCNGAVGASAWLVRQWVSYGESNCGPSNHRAIRDCRTRHRVFCTPVEYLNAFWVYAEGGVPIWRAARESWWLHVPPYHDAAHRLYVSSYGGGHAVNQANPAVDAWFGRYVRRHYNAYPALMLDDQTSTLGAEFYYAGVKSSLEIRTNRGLRRAHQDLAGALTRRHNRAFLQIDNSFTPTPYVVPPFAMLGHPSAVEGLVAESAPEDDGTLTPYYTTLLDDMAHVDATRRAFIVLLSYDPAGALQSRRVQVATALLGYSGGHIVSWSELETDSNRLAIWPEEGLVPRDPLESMSRPRGHACLTGQGVVCSRGGHHDLEVARGVFRREFGNCYYRGNPIGRCAAIVNTTGGPVTVRGSWLRQGYQHQIVMVGGDVQSGGRLSVTGASFSVNSTVIAPHDAVLLTG